MPMLRHFLIFALCLAGFSVTGAAHAMRIKDVGTFQGLRSNQLTGYGIVVGLYTV